MKSNLNEFSSDTLAKGSPTPQAYRNTGLHMPFKEIQSDAIVCSEGKKKKKKLPASIYKNPALAKTNVNVQHPSSLC